MKFAVCLLLAAGSVSGQAQRQPYPVARKSDQVDDYHGTRVADPYRWLEDDRSAETLNWVKAENRVTAQYLDGIPFRPELRNRLDQLQNYVRYTPPFLRGGYYFFRKNDGLQNQNVVYVQRGLNGTPRLLLDPNTFSKDGTSRLAQFSVSKNGAYAAYTISTGGSDWQEGHVLDVATGKTLADRLHWLKVGELAWAGDGFFYSRYPEPQPGHELSSKNEDQMVYFHRTGTPQSADRLIYEDKAHPQRFNTVTTTEDERYAFLNVSERGKGKDGNALYYRDLAQHPGEAGTPAFTPIVNTISDDRYALVGDTGGKFLIETNAQAPNSRVALFDPKAGKWSEVIREKPQPLKNVTFAGGKLLAQYSEDVASRVLVFDLAGRETSEIPLETKGVVTDATGTPASPLVFYEFSALTVPGTIYKYDVRTGQNSVYHAPHLAGFDPARFESKEIFYRSKDGTRVPMFLAYKKGLQWNGRNPALLIRVRRIRHCDVPEFFAAAAGAARARRGVRFGKYTGRRRVWGQVAPRGDAFSETERI